MAERVKPLTDRDLDRLALSVLRRLAEPGAVLGMLPGGAVAVVARRSYVAEVGSPAVVRTRETCRAPAEAVRAFIARGWLVRLAGGGRVLRYGIAPAGLAGLDRLIADRARRRSAPPAPLALRLARLRRHDGGPMLWPHEVDFAVDWAKGASLAPGAAAIILGDLGAGRGDLVARIARGVLVGGLPFSTIARREGVPVLTVQRLTATAIRCLGAGWLR